MNVKEFIEKWNNAFEEGKVNIYIAENNSDGIIDMTRKMKLNALDMFCAFRDGDYKYDDAFIYMSRNEHKIYSYVNINSTKDINYTTIGL
jgi:hypothetical protein